MNAFCPAWHEVQLSLKSAPATKSTLERTLYTCKGSNQHAFDEELREREASPTVCAHCRQPNPQAVNTMAQST
jgi:hypothetical protein